jgi:putative DNA primase/helicase
LNATAGDELRIGNYILKDTDLFVEEEKDGKKKTKYVAKAAKVKNVLRNLEDGHFVLEIEFFAYGEWHTICIDRGKLVRSELSILLNKGLDVQGPKANHVFTFLDYQAQKLKPTYYHTKLGWFKLKAQNQIVFRLHQATGDNGSFSRYDGPFLIEPLGSYEDCLKTIREDVIGHTPLEMLLSASLAAPIIAMLNIEKRAEVDSLLINLVGNSTIGKTTAAMVSVCAFGSPSINNNGLVQSFNGTANALQSIISGNFGVPVVLDEVSMAEMKKSAITSLIYKLAQNKEKSRLDKEANLKDNQFWCTCIFFTGESSMLEQAKNNEGLRVRLFEFKNIGWTKDGDHAERIKKSLINNYGYLGPVFV